MLLDRPPDVAQVISGMTLLDRAIETLFRDSDQLSLSIVHFTDGYRRRRVADETVERYTAIDRKDIPILQNVIRRKAVNDLFVHRSADGKRKPVVTLERRQRARIANHF